MKKLALSLIATALLAGCGTAATLPTVNLSGMASFEAMGVDDVTAFASKTIMRKQMKVALEANTKALMTFADRDPKDGRLTFDELQAKMAGFSRSVFRSKDTDNDGALVLSELVTESTVSLMTERIIRIRSGCLKALDKDGDRQLTRDDLMEANQFQLDPQPWSAYAKLELEQLRAKVLKDAFASKDVDGDQDGKLNNDELYAFFLFAVERGASPIAPAKPHSPIF
ncbi:EF hand [compost metagenome]